MTVATWQVCAALPIGSHAPCFATLLFTGPDSNAPQIQNFGNDDIVTDFVPLELTPGTPVFPQTGAWRNTRGRPALFGFAGQDGTLLIGERADLAMRLRPLCDGLEGRPFLRHQVAKFTGDADLVARAAAGIAAAMAAPSTGHGDRPAMKDILPDVAHIPLVRLEAEFFRITRARSASSMIVGMADDDLFLPSAGNDAPLLSRLLTAPFIYPPPFGTRFDAGGHGVLYAAYSLDAAITEFLPHRASIQMLELEGAPSRSLDDYIAFGLTVAAAFHDLRPLSALLDHSDPSVARDLGTRLRAAGSVGLLYNGKSANQLCLFSLRPIRDARMIGQGKLTIFPNGRIQLEPGHNP